jgi:hypothetical protein
MTEKLEPDVRESIINESDENLTNRVVYSVANRERAKLMEERLMRVRMSDIAVQDGIEALIVSGKTAGEINKAETAQPTEAETGYTGIEHPLFTGEREKHLIMDRIETMNPDFKRRIAYIVVNGSVEERGRLRDRINALTLAENRELGVDLFDRIKAGRLNHTLIRSMLKMEAGLREILESQL